MRSQLIWGYGTDVEQQWRLFVPREHPDCTRARFLDAELPFCLADIIRQNTVQRLGSTMETKGIQ
jgi:hypothetical protein